MFAAETAVSAAPSLVTLQPSGRANARKLNVGYAAFPEWRSLDVGLVFLFFAALEAFCLRSESSFSDDGDGFRFSSDVFAESRRMLGTKYSENPARKQKNISATLNASASPGGSP